MPIIFWFAYQKVYKLYIRFLHKTDSVTFFFRDLVPYLAQQGHKIEVMIGNIEYRTGRLNLDDILDHPNVTLHYIPTGRQLPDGTFKKIWAMIAYTLGAAFATLFGRTTDLNCFLTQPPLFFAWGMLLKALRRQPYCVLIMDLYPDVAIASGHIKAIKFAFPLLKKISHMTFNQADAIFVIGRCMQAILEKDGIPAEKIHILPLWANEDLIYPVEHADNFLRDEFGLTDKFVVLYSGNMGIGHYFDDILEVACRLKDNPDLRFVFIGGGARKNEIIAAKEHHQLSNVLILPSQPDDRLAYSLGLGDVHFVSLRDEHTGLMVPSKAYGIYAAGRATIYQGQVTGEIGRQIIENKLGTVVGINQSDDLEKIILHYYNNPDLTREQGSNALALSQTTYSRQQALQNYIASLQAITALKST